jgi:hypothetical protein
MAYTKIMMQRKAQKVEARSLKRKYPWLFKTWDYKKRAYVFLKNPLNSMYYDMPRGWRIAFGNDLLRDLDALLKSVPGWIDDYHIDQIKEKFGSLRWYDSGYPEEVGILYKRIMAKYEVLSGLTCLGCGKPATHYSRGWIAPLCDSCGNEPGDAIPNEERDEKLSRGNSLLFFYEENSKSSPIDASVLSSDMKKVGFEGGESFRPKTEEDIETLFPKGCGASYVSFYESPDGKETVFHDNDGIPAPDGRILYEAEHLVAEGGMYGFLFVSKCPDGGSLIFVDQIDPSTKCRRFSLVKVSLNAKVKFAHW